VQLSATLAPAQSAYQRERTQLARGNALLNGQAMAAGDGAAVRDENLVEIRAEESSEILLFDMM